MNQQPYKTLGSCMVIQSFEHLWQGDNTEENARAVQCKGKTAGSLSYIWWSLHAVDLDL